jgi:DNA repair protein RecO (recombination protein O)
MIISSSAIVLSKLKYRDNDLIIKLLVRELGLTSFIVRGGSKKNKINYFQQLSLLEIEFDFNSKRNLHYFKDFESKYNLKTIHIDFKKMGVIIFLSEVLSKILIHQQKDYQLYDFIEDAIKYYDKNIFSSTFHIVFLINLSKFLGFYPDMKNNNYQYFDLQHGFYTNTKDSDYIIYDDDLKCFNKILGINFDKLNTLTFTLVQRKKLLENIILYYRLHIENFVSVKSLEVLRKLF